jgi:peroxiredoxin Q/BCP
MCSLRDAAKEFEDLGVLVYGLSLDDVESQAAFAKAQGLAFPLLSDPDGSAAAKYGVLDAKRGYTQRVTFVLDDKGVLRAIDEQVDVTSHGTDLADRIHELRG